MTPSTEALAALHQQIQACRACAYGHAPSPVVEGQPAARLFLVGQAPGKTEEASGRPWAGPAGKRLMRWMVDEVGFASPDDFRRQVYFAAVTRCFPGSHPRGHGDLKPGPAEIARCAPFLAQELALIAPEVIVLVGAVAIERFLGKVRLDEAIGRVFPQRFPTFEALMVPLPHPSGASTWLNHPTHQALLADALHALRRLILDRHLAELAR